MTPRQYALYVSAALISIFLSANALVGVVLRGARLDLTSDHLYSLSPGTRRVIAGLAEPVDLTFYYSRDAAAKYPLVRAYAARVREMLQSYAGRARGMLRVHEVEPLRFSETEDAANAAGITPITPEPGGEPIYLGLSGSNAVDERETIPALSPVREQFMEYDITRLISELDSPRKLNVAVISSLPLDAAATRDRQTGAQQPLFFTELVRGAAVEVLPRDFAAIPEDASVLAILQPWPLSEPQLYAIDQFLMSKGRAFIAVDPAAVGWDEGQGSIFGAPPTVTPSASLKVLFDRWGVSLSADVVIDGQRALTVQTQDAFGRSILAPQPLFFRAGPDQMSHEDLITAGLQRQINFAAPGALSWTPVDGVTVTPLVGTSKMTMRIPAAEALARPSPQDLARRFAPSGRVEPLAIRLSGILQSAYGLAPPMTVTTGANGAAPIKHLSKSAHPAEIVIVSDVDFLNDGFYVGEGRTPFADNGAFALNAIDLLSGVDALVSLRSRASSLRPLEVIEDMRAKAAARLADTQAKLRDQLSETEARLSALQGKGQGSGYFAGQLGAEMNAQEREEVERFRARALQVRADLRATERDYRHDVEQLQNRLMLLNIALAPMLTAAAGLFVFWRRARRAGGAP